MILTSYQARYVLDSFTNTLGVNQDQTPKHLTRIERQPFLNARSAWLTALCHDTWFIFHSQLLNRLAL